MKKRSGEPVQAVAYLRTSSATNIGADKDADVRMPGMSGPELAQVARRLRPDLRIVLTSGYVSRDDVPEGIPFVPKPWRTGDLVDVVGRAPAKGKWSPGRAA